MQNLENASLATLEDRGRSGDEPIGIEELKRLDEHLQRVVEALRKHAHVPEGEKKAPAFNATALAKLCGKSNTTMLRLLERAETMGLASGVIDEERGAGARVRRAFSQAEAVEWVRAVGSAYKRPIGVPGCTVAVGNFKGGVGKTVVATSLAQGLSLKGYKVLCIDLDPQGSMTSLFDVDRLGVEDDQTFLPLTTHPNDSGHRTTLHESIQETYWYGVDLVAGSTSLFGGEFYLPLRQMRAERDEPGFRFMEVLDRALDKGIRDEYDYIVVDTPPALSYITMNGYWAADAILMPLPAEGLDLVSSAHFWSMFTTLATSASSTATKPKAFSWIATVPSKVDHSKGFTKSNLKVMQVAYDKYLLGNVEIPLSSAVSVGGVTLSTVYDMEKYVGSAKTYERARQAFDRLADEVDYMTRLKKWRLTHEEIEKALGGGRGPRSGA
jgi:chromosome partitioning protein